MAKLKSGWNYRIMRHEDPLPEHMVKALKKKTNVWYGLHEVHYRNGKPHGWTEDSMVGAFESKEDLIQALAMMMSDVIKHAEVLQFEVTNLEKSK